jgi:adenosylmethionine-8-amino-7-oxononanoate aminotransferase
LTTEHFKTLVERDANTIWHPYTQHKTTAPPLPIIKGEGVYLFDENGRKYIDAISSWWTNIHGHSHPYIAEKIYAQAKQLEHVIFAGCTHEPAVQLAERLLPLLPGEFSKVFYSDNGSTAVEVALKMAIQSGGNQRKKLVALKNSYHGDTFGAMSVSERGVFTLPFLDFLFEVHFLDPLDTKVTMSAQATKLGLEEVAAFIYEPLLQAAGGMNIYDAENLNELLCTLKQNGVTTIADEVMTGFGRTGNLFASEFMHHKPDIICLSKGLTGGCLPLAITACHQKIFDKFLSDDLHKTFFHGHSYTANPIACAASLASLDLLQQEECLANIEYVIGENKKFVQKLQTGIPAVINPRSIGTVLAFEIQSGKKEYLSNLKERIINLSLEQGIFLRPLGNTIYVIPPYCITPIQLQKTYSVLELIATTI